MKKAQTMQVDYVVVGGGSAGCIVAARLAEEKCGTVLLLEAGDKAENNPETLSHDGFKYAFANDRVMIDRMSVEQPACGGRNLYMGSGRGMGGSGSVNGMVYTRGDKQDFDQWPEGWKWQDVAPAYEKLEQRLRIRHREPTTFTEIALDAAENTGFKRKHGLNDGDLCGYMGYNDMNFEGENRRSSYVAFIKDNANAAQLTVKTKSLVQRIVFDASGRAEAVDAEIDGVFHTITVNKEVVLCAGALETPKLLMLSGVGPKAVLQKHDIAVVKDIPSIGRNLKDHPNVCIFYQGRKPVDFGYPQLYGFQRFNDKLALPQGQADTCIAFMAAPITLKQSLYRMAPANVLSPKLFFNPLLRKLFRVVINIAFSVKKLERFVNNLYGIVVILGKPLSTGSVELASNRAKDPALVNPAYYTDPADMETMLNAAEWVKQFVAQEGMKAWGSKPVIPAMRSSKRDTIARWIYSATMTTFHYCGTCMMGREDDKPVDLSLKLKGFSNVRIADASVMPEIPVSALNAPSMMIGYRAADMIINDSRQ